MDIQVVKKDGRQEPFDRNKIFAGIVKSGASTDEAEKITSEIERWGQGAAIGGTVKAADIRAKVLELLNSMNPVAGSKFGSYQKPVQPVQS